MWLQIYPTECHCAALRTFIFADRKAWAIPAAVEVLTKPLMHERKAHAMRKQTSSFASI